MSYLESDLVRLSAEHVYLPVFVGSILMSASL